MRKNAQNIKYSRTSALRVIVSAVVLVLFFTIVFCPSIADAVCPDGYVANVKNLNRDWQSSEDNLDLKYAKSVVDGWFENENYDFSDLEKNPIVVAVIDSGINFEHEIFTGKYDENGESTDDETGLYDVFYRDTDGNIVSTNIDNPDLRADDKTENMHGTHVTGIVATLIHELNIEKYIKIMPIKSVNSENKFPPSYVKSAIEFAIDNGADVVNMSLCENKYFSPTDYSSEFNKMITDEYAKQAVFVAAAGNGIELFGKRVGQSSRSKYFYPGASKNVIGVMNYFVSDGEKTISSSSNYGDAYDICAPGTSIYSANGYGTENYQSQSGTSMASPIIAFASALAMLKDRALCAVSGQTPKSCAEIADCVKNSYNETISKDGFELNVFSFKPLLSNEIYVKIVARDDSGDSVQNINDVKTVKLQLKVYPKVYEDGGNVTWYVNDKKAENVLSDVYAFEYLPKNAIGTTKITAEWTNADKTETRLAKAFSIEVRYVEYSKDETSKIDIAIAKNGTVISNAQKNETIDIVEDETLTFSIDESVFRDTSPDTRAIWYVDGKVVDGAVGNSFSYVFKEEGVHYVKAKIANNFTSEIIVKVAENEDDDSQALEILTICVSCALAVCLFATAITIVHRKKRIGK